MSTSSSSPRVVIVGAGLSGILFARALKVERKFENFTIYEKTDGVGGTWLHTTYPGCGSDVPGHWYSLSSELNPYWKGLYSTQPEQRDYWYSIWKKHDLDRYTQLNTAVTNSTWDAATQTYTFDVKNSKTGETRTERANVLIWAIGGFVSAAFPTDIPGTDIFKGEMMHSARWDHSIKLAGKRVAVIGNGCSAAQFVPKISEDPTTNVISYCRTPQWYYPKIGRNFSSFTKFIFAYVPFALRFYRAMIFLRSDITSLILTKGSIFAWLARIVLTAYIKFAAPKKHHKKLIPPFSPGCKRIIVDPDYLKSLHRPNVDICWDAIESFTENSVKLRNGKEIPTDVIIFGTGYSLYPVDLNVTGSKGVTAHEHFKNTGGMEAYLGTAVPGFPNLFLLLGPNVATGHASVIFSVEQQAQYALKMIAPVLKGEAKSFEIKNDVSVKYNEWIQNRMKTSVWTECQSFYKSKSGKNFATFPGPVTLFWWLTRNPKFSEYESVGAEAFEAKQRKHAAIRAALLVALAAAVAAPYFGVYDAKKVASKAIPMDLVMKVLPYLPDAVTEKLLSLVVPPQKA